RGRDVLRLAAAAGREVAAARKDAIGARRQHRLELGARVPPAALDDARADAVARRGVRDEDDLAVLVRERVEPEREPLDVERQAILRLPHLEAQSRPSSPSMRSISSAV